MPSRMKRFDLVPVILQILLCTQTQAYPTFSPRRDDSTTHLVSRSTTLPDVKGLQKIPDANHPYADPLATDQRGPCPGLNALANHGYIPRNGIMTMDQLVSGCSEGFNLAQDTAVVLSAISITLTGNPLTQTVSIGGSDSRVDGDGLVASMFGKTKGMDSHNTFEADGSLSRFDYYLNNGDDYNWQIPPYLVMSDVAIAQGDDYGLDTMHEVHYLRWKQSKTTNPYWWNVPVSAILTTGAASFVPRCFANGTFSQDGVANAANIDPFFGAVPVDEARSNFTWVFEKFPDNWFRSGDPYGLREVVSDILDTYKKYPEMLIWGGNAGSVNSFVPLGITTPTDLNGFGCFLYNAQMANLPNQLSDAAASAVQFALTYLDNIIGPIFSATFGCGPYVPNPEFEGAFRNLTTILNAAIKRGRPTNV